MNTDKCRLRNLRIEKANSPLRCEDTKPLRKKLWTRIYTDKGIEVGVTSYRLRVTIVDKTGKATIYYPEIKFWRQFGDIEWK